MKKYIVLLATFLLANPVFVHAHGGKLDRYGCHSDSSNGNYHCHKGPFAGQSFGNQGEMLALLNRRNPQKTITQPVNPRQQFPNLAYGGNKAGSKSQIKQQKSLSYLDNINKKVERATVFIVTDSLCGSGFFISSNHIMTNKHVVNL